MHTNSMKWLLMVALTGALVACNPDATCSDGVKNGDETAIDCGGSCAACPECSSGSDCASGVCVGGTCRAATCADGVKNGDESAIDCGGACSVCADHATCAAPTDCASGVCAQGVCAAATCSDGVKNGDETASDCGGSCAACPECSSGSECVSGVCVEGVCAAATCSDGVKNGDESAIDCGGSCIACSEGSACNAPNDCESGVCSNGNCAAPACDDTVKNGDESDTDCGGSCSPCTSNSTCLAPEDCLSLICTEGLCATPACDDGVKNGDESDRDCGGPCGPCDDESACVSPQDCVSNVCVDDVCIVATCHDTVKNGDETDSDCGGSCARCPDYAACTSFNDCTSSVCTANICTAPACDDTVQNGDEADLDCGGSCSPCADNATCRGSTDCASGVCSGSVCSVPTCSDGVKNGAESDTDCGGSSCTACVVGGACVNSSDCASTVCATTCQANLLSVSGGGQFACALLSGGHIKCWGQNTDGELGLGDTLNRGSTAAQMGAGLPTVNLGNGHTANALSAGITHACAILENGAVKCWGANASGELGLGDTASRGKTAATMGDALPTVELGTGRTAMQVVAGNEHTCAILDDGSVKCWGLNASGQLGLGDRDSRGDAPNEMGDALPTVPLGVGRTAVSLALSTGGSCALLDDGTAKCWGNNASGVAGQGSAATDFGGTPGEVANLQPIALGTGRTALQLAAGYAHVCALLDDFSLKCWGYNDDGRLGLGDTAAHGNTPGSMGDDLPAVALGAGRTARQITAHANGACALLDDGSVKCWGINNQGQLGLGDTLARGATAATMGDGLPATVLATGRSVVQVEAQWFSVCARLDDDSLQCWGDNGYNQLGTPNTNALALRGDQPGEMGDALPRTILW